MTKRRGKGVPQEPHERPQPLSLYGLTPEQAIGGFLATKPDKGQSPARRKPKKRTKKR